MGLHFFDKSPSWPSEQLAHLRPPTVLLQAGIPCVVWAEDALSIVHRVPTVLFDTQILVSDDDLHRAAHAICSRLPYAMCHDDGPGWKDVRQFNKDLPHAFDIGGATLFLRHHNPEWARQHVCSLHLEHWFVCLITSFRKSQKKYSYTPPPSSTSTSMTHLVLVSIPSRRPRSPVESASLP